MAFNLIKILGGRMNVPETLEMPVTASEAYKQGEALVVSSGKVTKASGDVSVAYISLEDYTAPASNGRKLKCFRVTPGMLFEVPVEDINATYHAVGLHAQLHTDGLQITDAAAAGYTTNSSTHATTFTFGAEIVDMNGATSDGDKVIVALI